MLLPMHVMLVSAAAGAFDRSLVSLKNESGALQYYVDGERISPWHDVPFSLGHDALGTPLLSFVCEIPRHSFPKVEIHKTLPYNPLVQDTHKDGSLRYYVYSAAIVNYGAIAQTWEDPADPDEDTGLGGDNDPIDVLQLNEGSCEPGAIQRVRVLGALALVDGGETDWKLLVIDVDAADAPDWTDVGDIPVERVSEVREWYRNYKTAEGKSLNKYGLDGRAVDAAHALRVARHTNKLWAAARKGTARCEFKKQACWMGEKGKDEV
jgi:inorganic pyrophosphatase